MLQNQHIGADAANAIIQPCIAYAANAAIDTNAAMQSGMLQSWQSNHYVTQMQQSGLRCKCSNGTSDADNAAIWSGHAVNATAAVNAAIPTPRCCKCNTGIWRNNMRVSVSVCCKTSITVSVSFRLVSLFRAKPQHPQRPIVSVH